MTHSLNIDQHGFLHSKFIGTIDESAIETFIANLEPFLATATPDAPLHFLADAAEEGKWTFAARRQFTALFDGDDRLGRVAVFNATRTIRVISSFMVKAAGKQDEVRFFVTQGEAETWLLNSVKQPA